MSYLLIVLIGLRCFFYDGAYLLLNLLYDLVFCAVFFVNLSVSKKFFFPRVLVPLLLFLIFSSLSCFFSVNVYFSQKSVLEFFVFFMIFLFAFGLERRIKIRLFYVLAGVGVVQGLRAFYQYVCGLDYILRNFSEAEITRTGFYAWELLKQRRAVGWFATPSLLGSYLLLSVPLLGGLAIECFSLKKKRQGLFWLGGVGLLFLDIVILKTAGVYLAFLAGLAVFAGGMNFFYRRVEKKKIILALIGGVFIGSLFYAGISSRMNSFTDRGYAENSLVQRTYYWKTAGAMICAYPWSGTGPGTFGVLYPKFKFSGANETIYAHNFLLQICAENGVFSVFFLCAGFLIVFFSAVKKCRQDVMRIAMISGLAAFLFYNLVDYSFFVKQCAYAFWALLGALAGETVFSEKEKREHSSRMFAALVLTVICAQALILRGEYSVYRAADFFKRGDYEQSIKQCRRALAFSAVNDSAYYLLGLSYAQKTPRGFSADAVSSFQSAISLNPQYSFYYITLARYLFFWDRLPLAAFYAERALEQYPQNKEFIDLRKKIFYP